VLGVGYKRFAVLVVEDRTSLFSVGMSASDKSAVISAKEEEGADESTVGFKGGGKCGSAVGGSGGVGGMGGPGGVGGAGEAGGAGGMGGAGGVGGVGGAGGPGGEGGAGGPGGEGGIGGPGGVGGIGGEGGAGGVGGTGGVDAMISSTSRDDKRATGKKRKGSRELDDKGGAGSKKTSTLAKRPKKTKAIANEGKGVSEEAGTGNKVHLLSPYPGMAGDAGEKVEPGAAGGNEQNDENEGDGSGEEDQGDSEEAEDSSTSRSWGICTRCGQDGPRGELCDNCSSEWTFS
jgi:hypothetical protein